MLEQKNTAMYLARRVSASVSTNNFIWNMSLINKIWVNTGTQKQKKYMDFTIRAKEKCYNNANITDLHSLSRVRNQVKKMIYNPKFYR
jgi:hypothetical protein